MVELKLKIIIICVLEEARTKISQLRKVEYPMKFTSLIRRAEPSSSTQSTDVSSLIVSLTSSFVGDYFFWFINFV